MDRTLACVTLGSTVVDCPATRHLYLIRHSSWQDLASRPGRRHMSGIMAAQPTVAVDQLVKVYKTTRAVDGISFALEKGSITGLLGGNGAGKTTTIAMILGLVMPTSGSLPGLAAGMPRHR